MPRFVWTYDRVESKKLRSPRWLITWGVNGEGNALGVERVIAEGIRLETSQVIGALEGDGHARWRDASRRVLVLTREDVAIGPLRVF